MAQSRTIHLSHNVSILLYHIVCPAKYRRAVFSEKVDEELRNVCLDIEDRYDIKFLEIGVDKNHVHFLVQSVPMLSPTQIVTTIKSITAREIFKRCIEVKKQLWGGEFWSDGYYVSTVAQYATETVIQNYLKKQGEEKEYKKLHSSKPIEKDRQTVQQLSLFD